MFLDSGVERRRVGAHDFTDLFSVLEEFEGGHGADGKLLCDIRKLVDVNFVEMGVGEFVAVLDHGWGDDFAGAAPSGEAIDHDQVIFGVGESRGPFGLAVAMLAGFNNVDTIQHGPGDVVDTHFEGGGTEVARIGSAGSLR